MVVENMPWCGENNGYGKDTVLKEMYSLKWRGVAIFSLFGGNNCKMRKADAAARSTSIEKKNLIFTKDRVLMFPNSNSELKNFCCCWWFLGEGG